MIVKDDLKVLITKVLHDKASTIFLKRATDVIEASGEDSESMVSSVRKVSNLVAFFIDESLAENVLEELMARIDFGPSGMSVIK